MKTLFTMAAFAAASLSMAQVTINECLVNPPGTDQGFEFFELKGAPNASLNGLTLLVIEGEGTVAGIVDQAISLNGRTFGANGLLLLRDSSIVLQPAPNILTNVFVQDFAPDIENGGQTYMIVRNFTGAVGTDLDTNNDGTLESTPWTEVLDSFAYSQDNPNPLSLMYAAAFGGIQYPQQEFGPDAVLFVDGVRLAMDVLLTSPSAPEGPYTNDVLETINPQGAVVTLPTTFTLTPGSDNFSSVLIVNPTSVTITGGQLLSGSLSSLLTSDNQRLLIINDENDAEGTIEIATTSPITNPSSVKVVIESISVRDDQSQFARAFNYSSNQWDDIGFRISSLSDVADEYSIANPANYISGSAEMKVQVTFIPSQDLDSGDGWSSGLDQLVWKLVP